MSEAYKKEFAFLEAKKRALQSRLRELKADRSSRAAAEQEGITTLQNGLFASNENIAGLEEELSRLDQKKSDGEDLLRVRETLKRATDRLAEMGTEEVWFPGGQPEELAQAIASVFQHGLDHLKLSQQIRTTSGHFHPGRHTGRGDSPLRTCPSIRQCRKHPGCPRTCGRDSGRFGLRQWGGGCLLVANQAPTEGLGFFSWIHRIKPLSPRWKKQR